MMNRKKAGVLLCAGAFCLLVTIGCGSESNQSQSKSKISEQTETRNYETADIEEMITEVKENALKANKIYKGKYVKIVNGSIENIESNGDYFTLESHNAAFTLLGVKVRPQNSAQKNELAEFAKEDPVTVYGKVTDVGEIMGYTVSLDKLEPAATMNQMNTNIPKEPNVQIPSNQSTRADAGNLYDRSTPEGVFRYYHLAITEHQLPAAYDCYSDDFKSQIEYSGWASGYDTTLRSVPEKVEVMFNDGYRATLSYRLKAVDRMGDSAKTQYFIGECNLIKVNGIWKIDSISARYA